MALKNLPFSVWALLITLTCVSLVSSFMGSWLLARDAKLVAMEQLTAAANVQANMIQLLVEMGADEDSIAIQLNKITDYGVFGKTGEFVIAHKEINAIHIITKPRHQVTLVNQRVPSTELAEPLRLALAGKTGSIIAPDYREIDVLAAYQAVPNTNFGVVAKIDVAEINGKFISSFLLALILALVIAGIGSVISYRLNQQAIQDLQNSKRKIQDGFEGIINALSQALDTRDPYTGGHQRRVSLIAEALAKKLKLDDKTIEGVKIGALVHDIGKISVPAEILNKPGHLTPAEMELIKCHTTAGHQIMHDVNLPWPVDLIISQHHERIDGSGYPNGLLGKDICYEAKIVAVCDVLEAMTTHRPYRPQKPFHEAVDFLKSQRGISFDEKIVDTLLGMVESGELKILDTNQDTTA